MSNIHRVIWNRSPNKLIRYEERQFDDGVGHTAIITVAIYLDKNKTEREVDAYVKWDIK